MNTFQQNSKILVYKHQNNIQKNKNLVLLNYFNLYKQIYRNKQTNFAIIKQIHCTDASLGGIQVLFEFEFAQIGGHKSANLSYCTF